MGHIIVITGSDTEVGKTFIGAAIAKALVDRGVKTIAIKPVESGCIDNEPAPNEDGCVLAKATGQIDPTHALVRLREPLAPPVAADREGVVLNADAWINSIKAVSQMNDVVLVEAAGGLLSPLTWEENALSLAQKLSADIIVVSADKLGTINHSQLTLLALETAGITESAPRGSRLLGFVFSEGYESDHSTGKNAAAFTKASGFYHVLSVGRCPHWSEAVGGVQPIIDRIVEA